MKVLIVDDVSIMRLIIKETLMNYCEVEEKDIFQAQNGAEALHQYDVIKPDVVFLDITMPGLDGITVVKRIMRTDPEAYIVMCTSSSDKADVRDCIKAGAKDYIRKPPQPDRVIKAIAQFLPDNLLPPPPSEDEA